MKSQLKQLSTKLIVLTLFATLLQGCIFVVGAAAGAAAITVVYDHRTIQSSIDDAKLATRINDKINAMPAHHDSHIEITVFNGVVLLTGETPSSALRQQAELFAHNTAGVTRVYNQITLQGPTSSLTRTSDTWITTKIKSEMLATEDLKSSSIKVISENGTVYLMGSVTAAQADISVDIARQVSGVQRVVKIFQVKG